jgi:hypothetical protein
MNGKWKMENMSMWIKTVEMDENLIDECMNPQYMITVFSVVILPN